VLPTDTVTCVRPEIQCYSIQQRFHFCFETFHSRLLSRWAVCLPKITWSTAVCLCDDAVVDRLRVGWLWEGYHESRRCSRDTYPKSYITKYATYTTELYVTKYTSIPRQTPGLEAVPRTLSGLGVGHFAGKKYQILSRCSLFARQRTANKCSSLILSSLELSDK